MTELIPIEQIKCDVSTVKEMDTMHYFKLQSSIKLRGQLRNILVDWDLNVIEGRKIFSIMKELGYKEIEVKIIEGNAQYMLASQLCLDTEFSEYDFVETSVKLSKYYDLSNKRLLYQQLPLQNDDIDDFIESISFNMNKFNQGNNNEVKTGMFS